MTGIDRKVFLRVLSWFWDRGNRRRNGGDMTKWSLWQFTYSYSKKKDILLLLRRRPLLSFLYLCLVLLKLVLWWTLLLVFQMLPLAPFPIFTSAPFWPVCAVMPLVTNFIKSYLHHFFDDSHGLKASLKPLRRPFNRCQSRLEAINNGQDIKQINW